MTRYFHTPDGGVAHRDSATAAVHEEWEEVSQAAYATRKIHLDAVNDEREAKKADAAHALAAADYAALVKIGLSGETAARLAGYSERKAKPEPVAEADPVAEPQTKTPRKSKIKTEES